MLSRSPFLGCLLLALVGCNKSEPTKMDRGDGPGRETDPAAVAAKAQPMASSTAVASAEQHATRVEGARTENMGRNFEGRLHWRVQGIAPPLEITYLSHGERGRLQIERPGSGAAGFDAIFAGDQAIVLDHQKRSYRMVDLNKVAEKKESSSDVNVERTTDRRELSGLLCYPWRLSAGTQKNRSVRARTARSLQHQQARNDERPRRSGLGRENRGR